jgi:hypothetical protein
MSPTAAMVKVDKSTVINAPIERVWAVLRDFNGHESWHPAVAESRIENENPGDRIGAVRNFRLQDGGLLREQLLALSDREHSFSYCLLDTPIPLFNYVAHVALKPVTDGDRTFWRWRSSFTTPEGQESALQRLVGEEIYMQGFAAIRKSVARA